MAGPLGSTPGIIVGVGVGTAAATALEPAIELARQNAWSGNAHKILDVNLLARLVAQGGVSLGDAQGEAKRDGYENDKLNALVYLAQTVPGVSEALTLWRRSKGFDDLWTHSLVKAGLDARYLPFLNDLKENEPLSPQELAVMIQRGIVANDGILPVGPPTSAGRVPPMPMEPIDPVAESLKSGYVKERLAALAKIIGLPASPDLAARMVFRNIIDRIDFDRAISEGNTRNEWAPFLFEGFREILTAGQYAELELRGFLTTDERLANTDKHGMSKADSDLLYDLLGRAPAVHAITTGLARGGVFNGPVDTIPKVYLSAMQRSNVRPEYYNIEYANRYTYPSAFVLRALTQAGDITQAQSHQILLDIGWEPTLATTVSAKWALGGTAKTKAETKAELADEYETGFISEAEYRQALTDLGYVGHEQDLEVLHSAAVAVKKERDRAVTALHKLYVAHSIDQAGATSELQQLGMQPEAISRILPIWTLERDAERKQLTAAQIRSAYRKNLLTQAVALADLEERGYSLADATTYLAS